MHMDCPPVARGATRDRLAVHLDLQRSESAGLTLCVGEFTHAGCAAKHVAIDLQQHDIRRVAETGGGLDDRIEKGNEIVTRPGDRVQDLADRGALVD